MERGRDLHFYPESLTEHWLMWLLKPSAPPNKWWMIEEKPNARKLNVLLAKRGILQGPAAQDNPWDIRTGWLQPSSVVEEPNGVWLHGKSDLLSERSWASVSKLETLDTCFPVLALAPALLAIAWWLVFPVGKVRVTVFTKVAKWNNDYLVFLKCLMCRVWESQHMHTSPGLLLAVWAWKPATVASLHPSSSSFFILHPPSCTREPRAGGVCIFPFSVLCKGLRLPFIRGISADRDILKPLG